MARIMTRTLFRGGLVFDGTGSVPARADVTVEDGRVVDIGLDLDGDSAVELDGRTLLPGLFDCHVHVMSSHRDRWRDLNTPYSWRYFAAARNLRDTLLGGITFVRDAAGADLGVKQAREDGLFTGSRIQISLRMISQTGGHADGWLASGAWAPLTQETPGVPGGVADGPDEVRRKVRELRRMGAEVIKIATSGGALSPRDDPRHAHFRPAELEVAVEEATAAGLGVMAHAHGTQGIVNAVRAGVRSIEHGTWLDDEAIEVMLARGTWLVPTIGAGRGVLAAAESGVRFAPEVLEKTRMLVEVHIERVRRAVDAGVRIAMGTDAPLTPHGQNLRELGYLVEAGMTPLAALESAARSGAQLLGVDDRFGTIEPGKTADLVVVEGDALDVATLGDRVESVWLAGARVA
jgi:imidazolonepropionase-like amidohydrolase